MSILKGEKMIGLHCGGVCYLRQIYLLSNICFYYSSPFHIINIEWYSRYFVYSGLFVFLCSRPYICLLSLNISGFNFIDVQGAHPFVHTFAYISGIIFLVDTFALYLYFSRISVGLVTRFQSSSFTQCIRKYSLRFPFKITSTGLKTWIYSIYKHLALKASPVY